MSENLEELLDIADEENEEEYDLADDEEEALLDESYDLANKTHPTAINDSQSNNEVEPDVLDLDDETELDEDNEILNSTTEEEQRCRQDKFLSERVVPQKEQGLTNKFKSSTGTRNLRGGFNRGKRIMSRGNFHNVQYRSTPFQHRTKVLINPHFKGNVHIKHNVAIPWDRNVIVKKPVIPIQPWAQQVTPNSLYEHNAASQNGYVNPQYQPPLQNSRLPVHQRLGISTNSYNQSLSDNQSQFVQNFPQTNYNLPAIPQQQFPQNPIYSQSQFPNNYNMNQFTQPIYNNNNGYGNVIKPVNTQFQQQWPIAQPSQMQSNNFNPNPNYANYSVPPPQPQFLPPFNNNPTPNVNYPPNVPVVNNENRNTDVSFYKEQEKPFQQVGQFIGGSPTKRRFEFKGDLKKKKRTVLPSNLHEVKTVDVQIIEEEEDEEMRAYRKKIEQQKLIREKLLRQKEERRKQAAKKLQAEEEYQSLLTPTDIVKEEIPVIMNSKKAIASPPAQVAKPIKKTQVVRVNKTVPIKTVDSPLNITRTVSTKPMSFENVSADNNDSEALDKDQLTSFLSNRKIFAKDKSLADTSLVVVNNLATGTSEVKLRKLCQGVGDIQNLQMSAHERQATIQFKSVASAHAFYKKYQRFMLDLSMIQVTLKPVP